MSLVMQHGEQLASTPDVAHTMVWLNQGPDQRFPEDQGPVLWTAHSLENCFHPSINVSKLSGEMVLSPEKGGSVKIKDKCTLPGIGLPGPIHFAIPRGSLVPDDQANP